MPYEHIMDDQRVNETMRILTYDEAKTGVSAAIGVPADDWEKSFGKYVPTEITLKLAQSVAHPGLTNRELEVLQCLANGRSNKEIGSILYISEATVKGHVRSILTKLEAIGRAQAIAIATKRGLIRAR